VMSLPPQRHPILAAPRLAWMGRALGNVQSKDLADRRFHPPTATAPPKVIDLLALFFITVATIHCSGAWFWPQNSTDSIVVEQIFGTEFKYMVYATYLATALIGLYKALNRPDIAVAVFFLQVLTVSISASFGGSAFYGAQALVSVLGVSFGAYAAVRLLGLERAFNWTIATFTVILAASVLLSVLMPSVGTHTGLYFPGQWRGAFGHKNQLGFLAAMTLLLVLPTMNWRPLWRSLTALALALLCLIMARSGSSIILFAFGSVIFFSVMFMRKLKADHAIIIVVVALSITVAFVLKDFILSFISLALEKDRTFSGRTAIWQKMLELGNEQPFFGHGPYYLAIDTQFLDRARSELNFPQLRSAHNSYIENIIEFGYIGLTISLIPIFLISMRWILERKIDHTIYYIIISLFPILLYFTVESTNRLYTGVATLVINMLFCARQPAFRRRLRIGMPPHG